EMVSERHGKVKTPEKKVQRGGTTGASVLISANRSNRFIRSGGGAIGEPAAYSPISSLLRGATGFAFQSVSSSRAGTRTTALQYVQAIREAASPTGTF